MKRQFLILSLTTAGALFCLANHASAQNFVGQTKPIPGARYGTHQDAMKVLGPAARHRGNQGLPMQDTGMSGRTATGASSNWRGHSIWQRGSGNGNSQFGPTWRGNTIYNPGARTSNYNYYPQTYGNSYNQYQADVEQIRQGLRQIQQAVYQARLNRQRMQNYYSNQRNVHQHYYRW